ncbi:MAG TPA: hypothetical protein VGG64_29755 [Pirellulales bacterium]|jgi:hypothetical protein
MSNPASSQAVLDREFLEVRARVLEIAAALDRLDRADGPIAADARVTGINKALDVLRTAHSNRAEQVQLIFSRSYDQRWRTALGVIER